MPEIPWDAPATAYPYPRGLGRERADSVDATLRTAVVMVLSQTGRRGDGYKIRLDDGSREWEGPEIAALGGMLLEQ